MEWDEASRFPSELIPELGKARVEREPSPHEKMAAGSSTARKRSRRMATMPTFVSPWLSPTKPKDRKEYPPSFSKREIQDSAQAKKKTNSACGRAILPKSFSPIVLFPRRICWARKARAS